MLKMLQGSLEGVHRIIIFSTMPKMHKILELVNMQTCSLIRKYNEDHIILYRQSKS